MILDNESDGDTPPKPKNTQSRPQVVPSSAAFGKCCQAVALIQNGIDITSADFRSSSQRYLNKQVSELFLGTLRIDYLVQNLSGFLQCFIRFRDGCPHLLTRSNQRRVFLHRFD